MTVDDVADADADAKVPKKQKADTSYSVFNAVDAAVSKPVLGSDGAANWQDFRSNVKLTTVANVVKNKASSYSVAPTAPLKQADRAAGFTSWQDERTIEETTRRETGDRAMNSGYQHFKEKQSADPTEVEIQKERRRILDRRIAPQQQYYIPSSIFTGWKWDYVYTTRPPRGTGYYYDGADSVKELHGELQRPTAIAITATVAAAVAVGTAASTDATTTETTTTSSSLSTTRKTKKRKQIPAAAPVVIVRDPTHPLEQVAAAVQRQRQQQQQQQQQMATSSSSMSSMSLPDGWETAIDPTSQKPYYFHRATGQRSWDRPSKNHNSSSSSSSTTTTTGVFGNAVVVADVVATTTTTTATNNGDDEKTWQEAKDAATGKTYYYNPKTSVTTWDRPKEMP
jgi:WW domain